MNKKLLIGAAIAATLILTACVKKEAPKEEEQGAPVETTQQPEQPRIQEVPTEVDTTEIPTRVDVEHQETNNTTTTIRREYHDAPAEPQQVSNTPKPETVKTAPVEPPAAKPAPKPEAVKPAVEQPTPKPQTANTGSQSEDDAVAAAIAAATPALGN